ncbi:unnamed protein product [Paramecium octaurelia]|uniref:Uncharacterized protein n=1 Tax=Paramecium octaurelia TaxID=43137 RepID=A0A8S1Y2Z0_PAROT|nr:unnamed protein product [Paramecium octaurelia]
MNQQDDDPKYQQPHEQRINSYLKKPVKLTQLDPEIMKAYSEQIGQNPQQAMPKLSWWQQFMLRPDIRKKYNQYRRFSKETLPMLVFVVFSTGVLIKMEGQYDKMKQKVQNSKTLKEIEIEQEDAYIRAALEGKKINLDVTIQEPRKEQRYKFEDDDDDQNLPGFDTQDDFYEGLAKEAKQGANIPQEYQQQYLEYQFRKKQGDEQQKSKFDL